MQVPSEMKVGARNRYRVEVLSKMITVVMSKDNVGVQSDMGQVSVVEVWLKYGQR